MSGSRDDHHAKGNTGSKMESKSSLIGVIEWLANVSYPCEQFLQKLSSQKVGCATLSFDHSLHKYFFSTWTWQPTPVFLPGEFHELMSHEVTKESDTTKAANTLLSLLSYARHCARHGRKRLHRTATRETKSLFSWWFIIQRGTQRVNK